MVKASGRFALCAVVLSALCTGLASAWTQQELDMYDLVEEVAPQTFYEILGVESDASASAIRKAFRKLSLVMHPDKLREDTSKTEEEASEAFRRLVAVSEVLKDTERRQEYDRVLREGLPSWRNPVFYYRATVKLGLGQVILLALVFACVVQYIGAWGNYLEKRAFQPTTDKTSKKKGKGAAAQEPVVELKQPRILDLFIFTWPAVIRKGYRAVKAMQKQKQREAEQAALEEKEEEERMQAEEEARLLHADRKARRRLAKQQEQEERDRVYRESLRQTALLQRTNSKPVEQEDPEANRKTGPWAASEVHQLTKLVTKYPGGTVDRWQKIAEELDRKVADVTAQAGKVRSGSVRAPPSTTANTGLVVELDADASSDSPSTIFTQEQQEALEAALREIPSSEPDRWDRIAERIQGKTKADCIARYKALVAKVKERKAKKTAAE